MLGKVGIKKEKIERERGRLRGNEEYRELRKGQGREVEGEGEEGRKGDGRESEGRESIEGWQIKN